MSALRDAADRIARMGRLPARPADRQLQCEKAAIALQGRAAGNARTQEPWDDFLRRIGLGDD